MTTCSTAQSDSMPTAPAVRARWARLSGKPDGPALAYMRPNFMAGAIVEFAPRDKAGGAGCRRAIGSARARHSEAWRLCAGLTCPPIGEQRLRPLDAVRVVLPPGDLERALGLGVRLVLRAPRPERPREVEARAEVVRVDFQRAAELPLGVLRVAAEQARRVEEQRALSGERIGEVRRQLEGAIDLAPQTAKLGQRADAGPRAPHLTAEAAEDREVGERVAVVGDDRPLGLRERAVEQCRTLALGSVVGAVTQLERLARCRCARRIGGASHAHREAEQRDQTGHAATLAGAAGAANATGR